MPGPAGNSLFIPTGAAPSFDEWLKNDPFYNQNLKWIDEGVTEDLSDLNRKETYYGQNWQNEWNAANMQIDPNWDYGVGNAEAQAGLALQKQAHDNANRAEYLTEWLAGRGLRDSGQYGVEQGERAFQDSMVTQGIGLGLEGQRQGAAHEKTMAQNRLSAALAALTTGKEQFLGNLADEREGVLPGAARARGQAGLDAWNRANESGALKQPGVNAIWDEESQLYITADGQYYKLENGVPVKTTWSQQQQANQNQITQAAQTNNIPEANLQGGPASQAYNPVIPEAYVPSSPYPGAPLGESRPSYNPIPGAWGWE